MESKTIIIQIHLLLFLILLKSALTQNQAPSGVEGQIALVDGTAEGTGNVIIFHQGRWGKICDDGWNLNAAHVVCRALGYPRALTETRESYFGEPEYDFWLDDIRCYGEESTIIDCDRPTWGNHNCRTEEAAGVFCSPGTGETRGQGHRRTVIATTTTSTTTLPPPITTPTTSRQKKRKGKRRRQRNRDRRITSETRREQAVMGLQNTRRREIDHYPQYELRIVGGRNFEEGRVEVKLNNVWGVICSDDWGLTEAMIACKQAGLGYGKMPVLLSNFGGTSQDKLLGGVRCDGEEGTLSECYHEHVQDVVCSEENMVAGVICSRGLPDLVPNATLLQVSTYLQDRPMYYLQCAMEENCAAPSAFTIKNNSRDWHLHRRRLLRFSSSTWNFGTADFRPHISKRDWEWHLCHMHYHSMSVFAHYDILDLNHNRVAEGHKASFCLEDVQCIPDKEKQYQCKGYGDQGISVGCADDYLHDIDCQWIDITDVTPGNYIFKVHVNPTQLVAELDFNNNAVTCNLAYTGYDVTVTDCQLGPG